MNSLKYLSEKIRSDLPAAAMATLALACSGVVLDMFLSDKMSADQQTELNREDARPISLTSTIKNSQLQPRSYQTIYVDRTSLR